MSRSEPITRPWTLRAAEWAPRSAWALAVVQVVAGLALANLNQLAPRRYVAEFVVSQVVGTLAFASAGLMIASRRPHNRIGQILCGIGVGYGFTTWVGQYTRYTLVTRPGALPLGSVIGWLVFWTWVPLVLVTLVALPLLFPDGRLPSPRWRPVAWLAATGALLLSLELALTPGPIDASLPEVANPFAPAWAAPLLVVAGYLSLPLVLGSMVAGIAAQVVRYRRAVGDERQQIKWFACAATVLIAAFVAPAAAAYPHFTDDTFSSGLAQTVGYAVFPACIGIAVLRYRLYEIDLLINRALVYLGLSAAVVMLYIGVVGYLGALFAARGSTPVALIATGVVAVVFQPLRLRLQRAVNRLMYGERDEPYAVLSRLGQRLRSTLQPDDVLPTLVATVRDALRLPYVAVALRRDASLVVAAEDGQPRGEPLVVPLSYQGEPVGELRVSARGAGEAWSAADRRLLEDLAYQASAAVHGVWVMSELRRARERLVLAREEERRRLRGDLHDEIAPAVAALGLAAATVGELIPLDPAAATEVVGKLRAAIRQTVGDVRRLVYDLRPPTLDELGLCDAIREHIVRVGAPVPADLSAAARAQPEIDVEFPAELPPLPAAVEVAAFRLVQEALHNVLRHAQARRCVVRLTQPTPSLLAVEIVDDGVGLPDTPRAGVGLHSMRERAAELGGTLTVERRPEGGTHVAARLPIAPATAGGGPDGAAAHPDR